MNLNKNLPIINNRDLISDLYLRVFHIMTRFPYLMFGRWRLHHW